MGYLQEVLADSPLHYWRLADPGGGIANDLIVPQRALLGQVGTIWPYPVLGYSGPIRDGGSAELGNTAAFNTGGVLIQQAATISIEAWFWYAQTIGATQILVAWDYDTTGLGLGLNSNSGAQLWGSAANLSQLAALSIQTWHHLVGTWGPAGENLYVDGVLVLANAAVSTRSANLTVWLGRTRLGGQVFNGWISEVALYSGILPAGRVAAHYANADNLAPPVFSAAGGGSGVSAGGLDQQILNSVRKVF